MNSELKLGLLKVGAGGSLVAADIDICEQLGYTANDIVGQPIEKILPGLPGTKQRINRLSPVPVQCVRQSGESIRLHAILLPEDEAGGYSVLLGLPAAFMPAGDLSGFSHQQRLEAIGKMAGGIAHDFNNLLSILQGNLEVIQELSEGNEQQQRWIETGLKTAKRGSLLTSKILGFTRKKARHTASQSLNNLLDALRHDIATIASEGVTVNYLLSSDLWPTLIDADDFKDSVENLVINAREAMMSSGVITIKTYNDIDTGHVIFAIRDEGKGISDENIDSIFDPFFTTKQTGGDGLGLGLSIVHGFARRSHGRVKAENLNDKGAQIKIILPKHKEKTHAIEPQSNIAESHHTSKQVLIVDDEEEILEITRYYLEELGFQVYSATNAKQALDILRSHKLDLMITDVVMPGGIDGYALASKVIEQYPDTRILLCSGFQGAYHNTAPGTLIEIYQLRSNLLEKPFGKDDLMSHIQRAMAA